MKGAAGRPAYDETRWQARAHGVLSRRSDARGLARLWPFLGPAFIAAVAYIVSGVLFILALRGLSSPTTSQAGNRNGMIGMAIAVGTALLTLWGQGKLDALTLGLIVGGVAVGGAVGAVIARKVAMTSMPQLVAAFHSLVGMAACLVAVAAIHTPQAYGIATADGHVHMTSLIELSLGLAPVIVEQLLPLLSELRDDGTTIILVEQSVNVALTVAETAYFMEKGEIRFSGATAELLERPDLLRSVFLEGASAATNGGAARSPARAKAAGNGRVDTEVELVMASG